MREFTEREKNYILKNQSKVTLEEMARVLNRDWKEIYVCYGALIKTPEYKDMVDSRRTLTSKEIKKEMEFGYDKQGNRYGVLNEIKLPNGSKWVLD